MVTGHIKSLVRSIFEKSNRGEEAEKAVRCDNCRPLQTIGVNAGTVTWTDVCRKSNR